MKLVGITGGIGSGKTTVCALFELLGVPVFYADTEAKKLYADRHIKSKIIKVFGREVYGTNGQVDKLKLANIIFKNRTQLKKLNRIIHPKVQSKFDLWKRKHKKFNYVIKEAAIMIESGSDKDIDYLINVKSKKNLIINRLMKREGMTLEKIKAIMNEQVSDDVRAKFSDVQIMNDGKQSLIDQVLKIHNQLIEN